MFYKDYKAIYEKIAEDLSIETKEDERASKILDNLLQNKNMISVDELDGLIADKEVYVFGAGLFLEDSLIAIKISLKTR